MDSLLIHNEADIESVVPKRSMLSSAQAELESMLTVATCHIVQLTQQQVGFALLPGSEFH